MGYADAPTDPLGRDKAHAARETSKRAIAERLAKGREAPAAAEPKAPALSAMPPGGDDGAPPKPAKPRLSKQEHDALIARKRAELDRKGGELAERTRRIKAEAEQLRRWKAEAAELERLRRDKPGEFVRRLTGAGLDDVFRDTVAEERDPEKFQARQRSEEMKRQLRELQEFREGHERQDMARRVWAHVSAEVASYQERSEILRSVDRTELTEIVAGICAENAGATPRQALEAVEQRLAAARPKPVPKPAAKAAPKTSKPAPLSKAWVQQFKQSKKGPRT
jgi:hypothetical protein